MQAQIRETSRGMIVREDVRDGVHERNIDFDGLGDQVLDFSKHGKVVLALDVFWVGSVQAGNEASEGRDTDTFTDSENGCINVCGTSFECSVCIGDGYWTQSVSQA